MPLKERKAIDGIAIDNINNDLRQFRDLATVKDKAQMDHYFRHSEINQPHSVMLFVDTNEYKIAGGALTTHPSLAKQYNELRMTEGKPKSKRMRSGVVFSLKDKPQPERIRLDVMKEDVSPQAKEIIARLAHGGYIIYDAQFDVINEPNTTNES